MKKTVVPFMLVWFLNGVFSSCAQPNQEKTIKESKKMNPEQNPENSEKIETATFGAGCFWCVEAAFQLLEGVESTTSGYSGGHVKNPAYREVCNETTGHAEVIQIKFHPDKISYDELLEAFWASHDPTTLNQQGNDIGTQYRSVIFYHNQKQKELAEAYKEKLDASGAFAKPVATEITAYSNFYKAEDYHQNYFNNNGDQPYCSFVIQPKLEKFKNVFKDRLKAK